jgi:hypothetical protein
VFIALPAEFDELRFCMGQRRRQGQRHVRGAVRRGHVLPVRGTVKNDGVSSPCPRSGLSLVARVVPVQTALHNCKKDEGRPFQFFGR